MIHWTKTKEYLRYIMSFKELHLHTICLSRMRVFKVFVCYDQCIPFVYDIFSHNKKSSKAFDIIPKQLFVHDYSTEGTKSIRSI